MSETTLNARLQHASIGNGLTNINSIPKQGEIIFNGTLDNFRVGDGSSKYSNLSDFLPSVFTGASTSAAGTLGFVPAPAQKASGEADKFLCDDGSWKLVSGSGGTDTHYHTSLNNVDYGDTSGVNLGSWYAPTSSGTSANQLLLSQGTNSAPTWTTFSFPSAGTDKILSYVGGTGWSLIDTYSVVTDGSGSEGLLKKYTNTAVSSQTQSTKFLREDGTWAAPSYTTNTDAKVQQVGNHTSNWEYNILLKTNANNNEETNYVRFCDATNRPTINCDTGLLTAPGYVLSNSGKKILVGDGTSIAPDSSADVNKFLKWTGSTFTWDTGGGSTYSAGTGLSLNNNTFSLKTSTSSEIGGGKTSNSLYTAYGSTDYIDVDSEVSNAQLMDHTTGIHNNVIRIDLDNAIPSTNYFFTIPMSAFSTYSPTYNNYNIEIVSSNTSNNYGLIYASNSPITVEQILNCDTGLSSLGNNVFCVLRWYTNRIQLLYIKYDNPRIGALTCIDDNDRYYSCLPNIGNGLKYEPTSNNYARIELKTSSSTDIGGIKVASNSVSSAGSVVLSGTYYPIETTSTGEACVKVPTGGSYTAASTASGADNPGLLKVAADTDPNTGYKNTNFKIAVPIFYGNIKNLKVYNPEKETYDDGSQFTCHYVNIYDIINGLISDNTLVGILKNAIEKWEPPK